MTGAPGLRPTRSPRDLRTGLGWLALAAALAYTAAVHHGLGSPPGGRALLWWHPTRFLLSWDIAEAWSDAPLRGIFELGLPAAAMAGLVFAALRSPLARALSLACIASVSLFAFYALYAPRVWGFFHWRASVVMLITGLALGGALAAPLFAAAWLRRPSVRAAATYALVCGAVVAVLRNATGTDESLAFSISPWPAIPVFGLEIGAYAVAGAQLGLALGALGLARWQRSALLGAALAAAGLALPFAWMMLRFGGLPEASRLPALLGLGLLLLLVGAARGPQRRARLEQRARHLLLGALLVVAPLFCGRALATGDYTASRFARAERIIDALQSHYAEREMYPDALSELVAGGYLETIPRPRVGFEIFADLGWLPRREFSYQSLGSSYVLEFVGTEWVQCAYSPPWEDEEDDPDASDEDAGGSWSCPDARPKLW